MSLNAVANRKRKIEKPTVDNGAGTNPDPSQGSVETDGPESPPIGTPATISDDKIDGLKKIFENLNQNSGKGFSMNEVLSMDLETKGMPDVLAIPIGGSEHDMYRMLERTRLTNYQKGLYCDAIHIAQHGYGWKQTFPDADFWGDTIDLDFTIPIMGEAVVSRLRASVSVDGQSLAVFERTTSTWLQRLYEAERQSQQQARRGIQQ